MIFCNGSLHKCEVIDLSNAVKAFKPGFAPGFFELFEKLYKVSFLYIERKFQDKGLEAPCRENPGKVRVKKVLKLSVNVF